MPRTNRNPALWAIIFWSLLVHLPGVLSPLRDFEANRQCRTASMARNYLRHGMHLLSPEVDTEGPPARAATEFPIYSFVLALLYRVFGVHEIIGRILSMVCAAWGAVYLYRFVKRRLGERIAFWSALVMCSLPVHVYFTRAVQPESMALWGFLGFLYYADYWLFVRAKAGALYRVVLLGALAPLLSLPYAYILFLLWVLLGYQRYGGSFLRDRAWVEAILCIAGFTFAWYHYAKTAPVALLPLSIQEQGANLAPILKLNLWRAQFISRVPELVTTFSGLLLALAGFYHFRKAKAFPFFMIWLAAAVVYVPLLGEYGLIHRYALLPLAPIAAVWIACGIDTLREYAREHPWARSIAFLLILGIPLHSGLRIAGWYRMGYGYLTKAHESLVRVSKPNDLVLVSSHERPELLYYLDRHGYGIEPNSWRPEEASQILHRGVKWIFIPKEDNKPTLAKWTAYLQTRAKRIEDTPDYVLYNMSSPRP